MPALMIQNCLFENMRLGSGSIARSGSGAINVLPQASLARVPTVRNQVKAELGFCCVSNRAGLSTHSSGRSTSSAKTGLISDRAPG